jgi:putative ABC transport system permease protein
MSRLLLDLRFAVRMFGRQPMLAAAALITLALGVGANSAMFSIVDAMLLKPPPFRDPDRVVIAWTTSPAQARASGIADDKFPISWGDFYEWQRRMRSFSHLAMFEPDSVNLSGAGVPVQLDVLRVSGEFAAVLGTPPLLGRALEPGDDVPGRPAAILLGYACWRRSFGGDRRVIGRKVYLNGEPALVVGVMPPRFTFARTTDMPVSLGFPAVPDAWVPYCLSAAERQDHGRSTGQVIGRLRAGVGIRAAEQELRALWDQQAREEAVDRGFGVDLLPIAEQLAGGTRRALLVLWAAVGLVLLIACANVAGLLLARAASRRQEIAVRTAIGAGRAHLVRQLLAESGLLALAGGIAGLGVAALGLRLLAALAPPDLARALPTTLDARVLAFTLSLCAVTCIATGLLPAAQITRPDLAAALRDGMRTADGAAPGRRTRDALVVAELAVSVLLLTGAGLLLHSFAQLLQVDPGFRTAHVLAMEVYVPGGHDPMETRRRFYGRVVERLQALPGVAAAAGINELPLKGGVWLSGWVAEGRPRPKPEELVATDARSVTPRYFAAMGIPLLRGRQLAAADVQGRQQVAVVDNALARALWPGQDPIGRRLRPWFAKGQDDPEYPWMTVVGIVGSVRYDGLDSPPRAELYKPTAQGPWVSSDMTFVVRAVGDPTALAAAARDAVRQVDPAQPIASLRTLDQVVADSVAPRRFALQLLGVFAGAALALAAVGVYGVTYAAVVRRTRELGLRIALGAQPRQLLWLLLAKAGALVALGLAIGLTAALAATRAMASMLYGIGPADPAAYVLGALLLAVAALVSVWIPARRATRLDPMAALRAD